MQEDTFKEFVAVKDEIGSLRQDLATAFLTLTKTNETLSHSINQFVELQKQSLPISIVMLMFATLLAVIFGKEMIELVTGLPINRN